MDGTKRTPRRVAWADLLPALVLVVGLLGSGAAARYVGQLSGRAEADRFEEAADRVERTLDEELDRYDDLLAGTAGLFPATGSVDPAGFATYVAAADLDRYPAVEALIFGAATGDHGSAVVTLVEPVTAALAAALGIDLATVPEIRRVLEESLDLGTARLSSRLVAFEDLPGGASGPVFALARPVFSRPDGDAPPTHLGWVATSLSAEGFAGSITGLEDVSVTLVADGEQVSTVIAGEEGAEPVDGLTAWRPFDVYGRQWAVEVRALDGFTSGAAGREQLLVLLGGLVATSLITALLGSLQGSRRRDRRLLGALASSESRLRTLVDASPLAILETDDDGRVRWWNVAASSLFGWAPSSGRTVLQGPTGLPLAALLARLETAPAAELDAVLARSGRPSVELALTAAPLRAEGGAIVLAADITARKALEAELEHTALHDALTGLPNRALLLDRLDHALGAAARTGTGVAVLFLDLDRFKVVNDSLGHAVGDRLLVEVGRRLRRCVRPGDTVARIGGDEFVICCERVGGDATELAAHVTAALATPVVLEGIEVFVTTSVGIAVGGAGRDGHALLAEADAALYRAKERGRDRVEVFDDELAAAVASRAAIESALHRAVERGELRLHLQPVVDLVTGEVPQVEALVRWHHPERGLLPPAEFIPIAEEIGLISAIGEWALREACAWRAAQPEGRRPSVAVNIAARQLAAGDFLERVVAILDETGTPATGLCLEMTESVLVEDDEAARSLLGALRALGVTLAIDDFGTGYSSLAYLRRFPIDVVKLDRSFVSGLSREPVDAVIVGAVVHLAHALGLVVVAEGVEDADQLAELVILGCDRAQGYLFARPVPAAEVVLEPGLLAGRR